MIETTKGYIQLTETEENTVFLNLCGNLGITMDTIESLLETCGYEFDIISGDIEFPQYLKIVSHSRNLIQILNSLLVDRFNVSTRLMRSKFVEGVGNMEPVPI